MGAIAPWARMRVSRAPTMGPSSRALCNNLVLAFIIRQHRFASVPQALRHFNLHRQAAIEAVLSPT